MYPRSSPQPRIQVPSGSLFQHALQQSAHQTTATVFWHCSNNQQPPPPSSAPRLLQPVALVYSKMRVRGTMVFSFFGHLLSHFSSIHPCEKLISGVPGWTGFSTGMACNGFRALTTLSRCVPSLIDMPNFSVFFAVLFSISRIPQFKWRGIFEITSIYAHP